MVYTLGEAAKAAGKSKATISKAIKTGKISATKNDNGSFSIDPSELHRVYPAPPLSTERSEQSDTPQSKRLNETEIIALRVKLEAAEKRIEDLEEDREHWRQQANRLLASPTPIVTNSSFWARLFGAK